MRKNILLLIVFLLASCFRLWQIGNVPYGVANDEASYIYSSYTVWKTGGHDIAGKFMPLSINLDSSMSPVPVYLDAPFVGILGISPFSGRLPYVLLGIGTVIVLFFITEQLTGSDWIAFFTGLVLAVSPWHLLISRGAWDGVIALFFYVLGCYLFLKKVAKGSTLWSLPAFLLAFYSYHATKVFFVCFIPLLVLIYAKQLYARKREFFLFIGGSMLIVLSFLAILRLQGVTRQEALAWNDPDTVSKITETVNWQRAKSSAPMKLAQIVSNKPTELLTTMTNTYLGAFSLDYLFIHGDISSIRGYGAFLGGAFYLIDLPLLLLGLYYLATKQRKEVFFTVVAGLLLAPLPSAVGSGTTYVIRAIMLLPFEAVLVGSGMYYLFILIQQYHTRLAYSAICIVGLFYILFVSKYMYEYYFQFNTFGAEFWNKSSRELGEYLLSHKQSYKKINVYGSQDKLLLQYAVIAKEDPYIFRKAWFSKNVHLMGNVTFYDNCLPTENILATMPFHSMYVERGDCLATDSPTTQISDALEPLRIIWKIYEKK